MKLTIGMAVCDDFDAPWFTLMSARMHQWDAGEIDFVVVDNRPDSENGSRLRREIQTWMSGDVKYVALPEPRGTSAPRNAVFDNATGELVVCIDSHVLFDHGGLAFLKTWFQQHPECQDDLFSGPFVYPDLQSFETHLTDTWGAGMRGQWARSPQGKTERSVDINADGGCSVHNTFPVPFEIKAMGLGCFAARRKSWLRFSDQQRGFGGEEWYIHTKYRQAGRRCWCVPALRWVHLFRDKNHTRDESIAFFRNYVVEYVELGLPLDEAASHYDGIIGPETVNNILAQYGADRSPTLHVSHDDPVAPYSFIAGPPDGNSI